MGVASGSPWLRRAVGGLQFTGSQVAVGSGVVAVAKAVAVEGCVL